MSMANPIALTDPVPSKSRRDYHRAYYWTHLERRRTQARESHLRRQLRRWFGDQMPAKIARMLSAEFPRIGPTRFPEVRTS